MFRRTAWSRTRRRATGFAARHQPDHVQNGVAQYPVCGGAFFAPGIEPTAGYSFMSVLTHTTGRAGIGPRTNVCGFNSETWNGAATVWDPTHRLADRAHDRGPAQFRCGTSPGAALLGHLGFPLLDHEVRASCGRRAAPLSFSDFRDLPFCDLALQRRDAEREPESHSDKANALFTRAARCRRAVAAT
jgi:hypothetical protein